MARVLVVGAGVVGLTAALRLAEDGHRVDVLARDLPLETTSAVAAAIWYPYLALPRDRVTAWSAATFGVLADLAGSERSGAAGVRMREGTEVFTTEQDGEPWWRSAVPSVRRTTVAGFADAWTLAVPVVEMPVHLRWLAARLEEAGGTLTRASLAGLPPAGEGGGADAVVNCSGIGSRLLAGDRDVTPVRGQVVRVERPGIDRWWLHSEGPTYVVPREHDVVVGGTSQVGDWSRTPDPATAASILERASALEPRLRGARVVSHKVGLRPARPAVRVEREGRVVHCYGHGGAGVTLAHGCAADVVGLVREAVG
jgi:D-amino-acid oxidase